MTDRRALLLRVAAALVAALLLAGLFASCQTVEDYDPSIGPCTICNGTGRFGAGLCPTCRGLGYVKVRYSYPVTDPVK